MPAGIVAHRWSPGGVRSGCSHVRTTGGPTSSMASCTAVRSPQIASLGDDAGGWELTPHATIQYLVFPNTLIVHQLDHFELWRVFPVGDDPNRSVVEMSLYAPDQPADDRSRDHWVRNLDYLLKVT